MSFGNVSRNVRIRTMEYLHVIEIDDNGRDGGKCSLRGWAGELLNMMIEPTRAYTNCTLEPSDSFGTYNHTTKMYGGAVGLVQRGEADMVALPMYYPLHDPNLEYFDYSNPLYEDRMMIACGYNSSQKHTSEGDILNMITSVSYDLWGGFFLGYITFIILLTLGYRILGTQNRYNSPTWMVTSAFLFEDSYPDDDNFDKVVAMTSAIFLLFFGNYLMSCMSTDLIVYEPPYHVTTYQEILDNPNLQLFLISGMPSTNTFRDAPEDSIQYKLYEHRLELPLSPEKILITVPPLIFNQSLVTIMDENLLKTVIAYIYGIVKRLEIYQKEAEGTNALLSFDKSDDNKFTKVMVFSKSLDDVSKGQINFIVRRLLESGFNSNVFETMYQRANADAIMLMISKVSTQMPVMDPPDVLVALHNIDKFATVIGYMVAISIIVFILEYAIGKNPTYLPLLVETIRNYLRPKQIRKSYRKIRHHIHRMVLKYDNQDKKQQDCSQDKT